MFRTIATTLATTALIAASGASAQAAPLDLGVSKADPALMAASIKSQMTGRAYGWQFAIAQGGHYVTSDKGGNALSAFDAGGAAVPMQPTMKLDIASATKTITAAATMKLLRANGLTVDSSIDPYLPWQWARGPGFKEKQVTFRHLLMHTSGINQAIAAMPAPITNNSWDAMQTLVANGTVPGSQRQYKNANYQLLKIINADLWRRSGGQMTDTFEVENSKGVEVTKTVNIPVDKSTFTTYVLDYLNKRVFAPAGLQNISCTPGPGTAANSYSSATVNTQGSLIQAGSEECAGFRGLRLSSMEHVQFLAHLRHGSIVDPRDRMAMDEFRMGWWEGSNGADVNGNGAPDFTGSFGAFFHPGDYTGTFQNHTCGATFNDGTQVSLLMNSPKIGTDQCRVLINAWNLAK